MAKKYRSISIRLTEEEYRQYKTQKERDNLTWKEMLKRGSEKPAAKNLKKTLHLKAEYRKFGAKGFHPFAADFILIKVAATRRELDLFDARLDERGDFLMERLEKAASKDITLSEFFSKILGSKDCKIVFGTETIEETDEPEKEEGVVEKWGHV